jgi:Uma2 family endonuclease
MTALPKQKWTPESYLEFERVSETKHEYLDGEVYEMVGGSPRHNLIMVNTLATLHAQLRKRPCIVFPNDMRIKVSPTGLYTYPDLSVVCGEPRFEDEKRDTLLNPVALFEILSPSAERHDRGKKFLHYRALPSLLSSVLIAQDSYHIEHYARQPDNTWVLRDAKGMDAVLELPAIGCTLALADVYEKVSFDGEEAPEE